jgi:hypothetical protein
MKLNQLLQWWYDTNIPLHLVGAPGIGKTAAIEAFAEERGVPIVVIIGSTREPADITGLPYIDPETKRVCYSPDPAIYELSQLREGILFLDEFTNTSPSVQAALLRVVLERRAGTVAIPPGIRIIAASNPVHQAADGNDLTLPMRSRFTHIEFPFDASEWLREFPRNWGRPIQPEKYGLDIPAETISFARSLVASFLDTKRELILSVPEDNTDITGYPCPRTWDFVARYVAACLHAQVSPIEASTLYIGTVGEGAGLEFTHWIKNFDLPHPADVLAAPETHPLPQQADKLYTLLTAVANIAQDDYDLWKRAWIVMERVALSGRADVAARAARILANAPKAQSHEWPAPPQAAAFIPLLKQAGQVK